MAQNKGFRLLYLTVNGGERYYMACIYGRNRVKYFARYKAEFVTKNALGPTHDAALEKGLNISSSFDSMQEAKKWAESQKSQMKSCGFTGYKITDTENPSSTRGNIVQFSKNNERYIYRFIGAENPNEALKHLEKYFGKGVTPENYVPTYEDALVMASDTASLFYSFGYTGFEIEDTKGKYPIHPVRFEIIPSKRTSDGVEVNMIDGFLR